MLPHPVVMTYYLGTPMNTLKVDDLKKVIMNMSEQGIIDLNG